MDAGGGFGRWKARCGGPGRGDLAEHGAGPGGGEKQRLIWGSS